jgi:hypothetical protein
MSSNSNASNVSPGPGNWPDSLSTTVQMTEKDKKKYKDMLTCESEFAVSTWSFLFWALATSSLSSWKWETADTTFLNLDNRHVEYLHQIIPGYPGDFTFTKDRWEIILDCIEPAPSGYAWTISTAPSAQSKYVHNKKDMLNLIAISQGTVSSSVLIWCKD